jgi:transposase
MTLDKSVHGMRLRVIERAQALGNVSAVCRELGISRTVFYRWRKRLERYGVDGLHPRRQRSRAGRPVATPPEVERLVLGIAISAATWGCRRIAAYLARTWQLRLAPSTVQRLLRRVGLATRRARLTVLEQQAARPAGLLTERTRQMLWHARHGHTRHVEATEPGELVCLDTFYIGNLHRQSQRRRQGVADHGLRCGASSPTAARSSRGRWMARVERSVSGPPARSLATPGPTAWSNGCRTPSSRRSGEWPSGAATSPRGAALQRALDGFMRYYNTERPIRATASAAAPRPRWSGAWRRRGDLIHHSGTAKVSTPFRNPPLARSRPAPHDVVVSLFW